MRDGMIYFPYRGNDQATKNKAYDAYRDIHNAVDDMTVPLAAPFQTDYSVVLGNILNADKNKFSIQLPPETWRRGGYMEVQGLVVYILQNALMDGRYDVAALKDAETGAYIVLNGEHIKGWLDHGIVGFRLPLQDPVEEVRGLITLWDSYIKGLNTDYSRKQRNRESLQNVTGAPADIMQPIGSILSSVVEEIITPIFGPDKIHRDVKAYMEERARRVVPAVT